MNHNYSLSRRLQWIVAIVLIASLGITGLVLDQSFRHSSETEARAQLDLHFHSLLAEVDCCSNGFEVSAVLKSPGLNQRDSGLYAKVIDELGLAVWFSPSAESVKYDFNRIAINIPKRGDKFISKKESGFEEPVFVASYTVGYEHEGKVSDYTFVFVHSLLPLTQRISAYRLQLWGWLSAFAIFFMLIQGLIMRWAMSPLRKVVADLYAIQDGKADQLPADFPQELSRLTGTLNELLEHEKQQRERHRNSLADLAHSMKTPLTVLRSFAESNNPDRNPAELINEIERLDEMVSYQLQRAVIGGRKTITAPVRIDDIATRITRTLDKVYADKGVQCSVNFSELDNFYGEKSDIYEVLGNLIENAYKYTHNSVKAYSITDEAQRARRLFAFVVEDNGPGIPDERKAQILSRGIRLDTHEPGQGLGLAMVADVIDSYSGTINIETNHEGGARFVVVI